MKFILANAVFFWIGESRNFTTSIRTGGWTCCWTRHWAVWIHECECEESRRHRNTWSRIIQRESQNQAEWTPYCTQHLEMSFKTHCQSARSHGCRPAQSRDFECVQFEINCPNNCTRSPCIWFDENNKRRSEIFLHKQSQVFGCLFETISVFVLYIRQENFLVTVNTSA